MIATSPAGGGVKGQGGVLRTSLKVTLLTLMLVSLASAQTPQQVTLSAGSAVLADIKGAVAARSPQDVPISLRRGDVLPAGSTLETLAGAAVLTLQDGSQVLVKPNTRVVLKSPEKASGRYFELLVGKVVASIRKRLEGAPSFKLGTPTAVITVRGTRFSVEVPNDQKTVVHVFEGRVEVFGLAADTEPIMLEPGFSTDVERDQMPKKPRVTEEAEDGEEKDQTGKNHTHKAARKTGMGGGFGHVFREETDCRPNTDHPCDQPANVTKQTPVSPPPVESDPN